MSPAQAAEPTRRTAGRGYSARFHLLDRQVVDPDGKPVCNVDDLDLAHDEHGRLCVTAILVGPAALAPRLQGLPARWLAAVTRRMSISRTEDPARLSMNHVTHIGAVLTAALPEGHDHVHALEDWMRDNVIGRLPGAGHASG
ncbi:hypothetical protein J7E87_20895 [Streptomyces sp. ISL-1]|uniref:hypothetical protein n=1 Tax=Streptomyces sp. ISL-1 TaxID=2817657 RepID=UPI001BE5DF66|nr:hypothetical protein [Streptomyces sp. ISL-1]MBT2391822.1 hypothetical protein [Streptomyces sp. ISL-1]